ncbi:MAG: ergothioneine biosynthesis protein EgtB [Gemmatimonadota bacterium]|nr:ergothioneine biosynthesis protein EgtB [Gemmatimonadota bacterium]
MATTVVPTTRLAALASRYRAVRERSDWLAEPLVPEDQVPQSMPDCSPIKWHRAHTTWFFETFVLRPHFAGYRPLEEQYLYLFNSYYNAVGRQYARPQRGLVTRPTVAEVSAYRAYVDRHVAALLAGEADMTGELSPDVFELGLHHEEQHQELMVTDLKHLFSFNPLHPVYRSRPPTRPSAHPPVGQGWVGFDAGVHEIGHAGRTFAFDNETPRHRVFVEAFELATRPVTAGEYLAFVEDGGYRRVEWWLSDGWATVQAQGWDAPLYWMRQDDGWWHYTLAGAQPVDPAEPVTHLSYYEAEAYARWAEARLPTEAEWEVAAAAATPDGTFLDDGRLHPAPAPAGQAGPLQLLGDVWEWTQSAYCSYPGYRPPAGALGEYNAKFMSGQMVLRGGSCATPRAHIRPTYRNFFPPSARWQFTGIRLAR